MLPLTLNDFSEHIGDPAVAGDVAAWIDKMPADPSLAAYVAKLHGISRGSVKYWDLACALNYLARNLKPERYLEIGVRRGKSMAQIVGGSPDCDILGIDLWIHPYGGVDNPGPDFVYAQLKALGHRGALKFISGDSQRELPSIVDQEPSIRFDVVTVDGDHSDEGAWADLCNVAPLVNAGGYILFDDLTHPAHTLDKVWHRFQQAYSDQFEFVDNMRDHNGTGVARRVS